MTNDLLCWRCGASLNEVILPLSRRETCRACGAELHVCRLCTFYDPRITGGCREDRAEEVREKERANFCDWFKPRPDAYRPPDEAAARTARAQLEALFGETRASEPGDEDRARSETQRAREELERLFGLDDKGGKSD
jgi:hypothetical protein